MPKLVEVEMESGSIVFRKAEAGRPATTRVEGNVTINTTATAGRAAYFEVSFPLSVTVEECGITTSNFWTLRFVSPAADIGTPYVEVEAAAARQIAPMLRSVADRIEEAVATFDSELAEKAT